MIFNYLNVIWNVKMFLAKIKDGKGKEFYVTAKKSLPTKIRPQTRQNPIFRLSGGPNLPDKQIP